MFRKKIEFSETEIALQEMIEAKAELVRAEQMFNYANNEYFEIANDELTIAQLRYEVCFKKLKKLCKDNKDFPQMKIYKSYATV